MMYLNEREVVDAEIDGVDPSDYPDFCDAYFIRAYFADSGLELDEEELNQLTEENGDVIMEMAAEAIVGGYHE